MIKNPKLSQPVWFIEDFTMRPRKMPITHVCDNNKYVYLAEERYFRISNLYRSKKQAVKAKQNDLVKEVSRIWDQHNNLSKYLDDRQPTPLQ